MTIHVFEDGAGEKTWPPSGKRVFMVDPIFTVEALRQAAERKTGLSDYGSESYQAGLEPLLFAIQHEAKLHALGRQEMWSRIVGALANRLTLVAWENANPELADAPVEAPLVILGLGRTGSSILHETLATAPGTRTPLTWEVRDFSLAHKVTRAQSDALVQEIDAQIGRSNEMTPGYTAIHYSNAYVPMECVALTILDLCSEQFSTIAHAPSYRSFLLSHDYRGVYQWHRRALRYFQANTPGTRWVLKTPMHSLSLGALLETYPDAMIIQTHRDPMTVVASLCSLYATLRQGWSDKVVVDEQAEEDAAYAAAIIQHAVDYRRDHPEVASRFHDVAFKDFMADQLGTLVRIHDRFGLAFSDEARDAMTRYLESRPRDKYGKHTYSLKKFGMTANGLAPLFSDYAKRYGAFL